ncbi:MAG: enoyl-CoA hydratase/isomerase family protein [Propionibacteriaceae bacterium]
MTVRIGHPAPGVAELVMDRPEALNAVSTEQARAITRACAELRRDPEVVVVVLASALRKAFCVGADLKERHGFDLAQLQAHRPVSRAAYAAVLGLAMPTVAAVEGYALGGGCELALSCDLIVGSDSAVFGLPEVGVGLVPGGGGTQLLSRRIGLNRAADLIFTGRRVEAAEAEVIGLLDRRTPTGEARRTAVALAAEIATGSPLALRAAKAALRAGYDQDLTTALTTEDAAWARVAASGDRVEGIAAFVEHRRPQWPSRQR